MFERFTRGDSARTRESGGAGLGLSLVAAIAQAHGGTVSVASAPGTHAFEVGLPAARCRVAGSQVADRSAPHGGTQPGSTQSVHEHRSQPHRPTPPQSGDRTGHGHRAPSSRPRSDGAGCTRTAIGRGTVAGRIWRGSVEDPAWARPALLGLLAATALLYLWGLGASGWANSFYSAAAQAGADSWKAFFFGSSDAASSITVDKPPMALWLMALSVRIFGLSSWSILAPEALLGVASVGLLHARCVVRRDPPWPGSSPGRCSP